jgi:hypothetical protein
VLVAPRMKRMKDLVLSSRTTVKAGFINWIESQCSIKVSPLAMYAIEHQLAQSNTNLWLRLPYEDITLSITTKLLKHFIWFLWEEHAESEVSEKSNQLLPYSRTIQWHTIAASVLMLQIALEINTNERMFFSMTHQRMLPKQMGQIMSFH